MVVTDVWGGSGKRGRRSRDTQASAMACQRELGPEQRRHREEDGALEPVPVAKTGHDLSLPLTRSDATDPDQPLARPGVCSGAVALGVAGTRSEEHTSELQSLMRISYAVFCLKKKTKKTIEHEAHE